MFWEKKRNGYCSILLMCSDTHHPPGDWCQSPLNSFHSHCWRTVSGCIPQMWSVSTLETVTWDKHMHLVTTQLFKTTNESRTLWSWLQYTWSRWHITYSLTVSRESLAVPSDLLHVGSDLVHVDLRVQESGEMGRTHLSGSSHLQII